MNGPARTKDDGRRRTAVPSILLLGSREPAEVTGPVRADTLRDLNLDQVLRALVSVRGASQVEEFFCAPLTVADAVRYRQDVFQDLERPDLRAAVEAFLVSMANWRAAVDSAAHAHHPAARPRWLLDAASVYTNAVTELTDALGADEVASQGLIDLRTYLQRYTGSTRFGTLRDETSRLLDRMHAVSFNVLIRGAKVSVAHVADEPDYSAAVLEVFDRFRTGTRDPKAAPPFPHPDMDHIEGAVLDAVTGLFPEVFHDVERFLESHPTYVDEGVSAFERDVQVYLSYLDYLEPLRESGLPLCYPRVTTRSHHVEATETFDLALAVLLAEKGGRIVTNDLLLHGAERLLVITGPNQGGKTTTARTVGQLHHLARLGCPVPGRTVGVMLTDQIFTHFEREESGVELTGKLADDLARMHDILDEASAHSLLILNEIFTSTSWEDALVLSTRVLRKISDLGALCVCVTFLDELANTDESTVSMVSMVDPHDPTTRTFKVVRRDANGRAYATALADKYGLTYRKLKKRLTS